MLWIVATSNSSFLMDKLKLLKENAPEGVSRNKKHLPALTCMVCLRRKWMGFFLGSGLGLSQEDRDEWNKVQE